MKKIKTLLPVAQLFFTLSLVFGTWVIYIPHIMEKLNLSEGDLGFALFFGAIGSFFGIPIGKYFTSKYGEGKTSFYSALAIALLVVNIILASSYFGFCLAWAIYGIAGGVFQVAINSLVATVEKKQSIDIMSTCHGFFSLGGIISSGVGTFLIIMIDNPAIHVLSVVLIVFIIQFSFKKNFYHIRSKVNYDKKPMSLKIFRNGTLLGMGLMAIILWLAEGAIADWSSLFIQDVTLTKTEYAGLGYTGFSLSMTIGRFVGDKLKKFAGSWVLIIYGLGIAVFGFVIVLSIKSLFVIAGFFTIGLGFSIIIPEIFRLSSNIEGVDPSSGIAFIAGAGNVGFLLGPVFIGLIAENFSLSKSFMVLAIFILIALFLAVRLSILSKKKRGIG